MGTGLRSLAPIGGSCGRNIAAFRVESGEPAPKHQCQGRKQFVSDLSIIAVLLREIFSTVGVGYGWLSGNVRAEIKRGNASYI